MASKLYRFRHFPARFFFTGNNYLMMSITPCGTRAKWVVIVSFLFSACTNNETDSNEKRQENIMDTISRANSRQFQVQGKAGPLFIDDGGKAGIPVVLVHSFGGSTKHWTAQLQHLRQQRRAIAFDLRGHGQSGSPTDDDYHVQSLSNDIATIVDSLRLDQFILVGHSMGGSAAIDYAMRFPEKVAGLVLVGTPGKTSAGQAKPIVASLESEQYDTVMENYMKQLLESARPEVNRTVREGMKKIPRSASVAIIKSIFGFDPLPALSAYPGPKLIVSNVADDQPNSLSRQLPEVARKVITGTSHWIQMDKPAEFNAVLDEFIRGVARQQEEYK
jgi:pimeloyl-ACP methyl ester carboxylesterase